MAFRGKRHVKGRVNRDPLRKVVKEFFDEHGIPREELECGHVILKKSDLAGHTNAARRRCIHCRLEAQAKVPGNNAGEAEVSRALADGPKTASDSAPAKEEEV